jgi:hypothetical protein
MKRLLLLPEKIVMKISIPKTFRVAMLLTLAKHTPDAYASSPLKRGLFFTAPTEQSFISPLLRGD